MTCPTDWDRFLSEVIHSYGSNDIVKHRSSVGESYSMVNYPQFFPLFYLYQLSPSLKLSPLPVNQVPVPFNFFLESVYRVANKNCRKNPPVLILSIRSRHTWQSNSNKIDLFSFVCVGRPKLVPMGRNNGVQMRICSQKRLSWLRMLTWDCPGVASTFEIYFRRTHPD